MDYAQSEYLLPVFNFGVLHLELNTALFILVLFLSVAFVLNRLLFQPVLRTLDARTTLVNGVREDNARKQDEITRLTREYETRMNQIRGEIDQFRQEARREGARQAEGILSRAHEASEERLARSMDEMEREIAAVRGDVLRGAGRLAERITQRLLER